MLLKCTRFFGAAMWSSVADEVEIQVSIIGRMHEGDVCLVLEAVEELHGGPVTSHYKVLFDGKVGYVEAHMFEPLEQ
jgi:hypothetical protein